MPNHKKEKTIHAFYESTRFENLKETAPFIDYLEAEENKLKNLFNGGSVLEVGCGNGRIIPFIVQDIDQYVGLDFSDRLITQAKEKYGDNQKVRLVLGDAQEMPFQSCSFDFVVIVWNTFGNLHKTRDKVLSEAARVLKNDGRIFLSVFSERVLPAYLDMLKENSLVATDYDKDYVFLKEGMISERFSENKLKVIFEKAGLNYKIEKLTEISYWCTLEKIKND